MMLPDHRWPVVAAGRQQPRGRVRVSPQVDLNAAVARIARLHPDPGDRRVGRVLDGVAEHVLQSYPLLVVHVLADHRVPDHGQLVAAGPAQLIR